MSTLRIHATAKPTTGYAPVQPMSEADAEFWRLRRGQPPRAGFWRRIFGRIA